MNKYVTAEIARLAKECGYDEPCEYLYWKDKRITTVAANTMYIEKKDTCPAPTYTDIQTWLREVHAIDVFPKREIPRPSYAWVCEVSYLMSDTLNKGKYYEVNKTVFPERDRGVEESGTYDRALEVGIKDALKHLEWKVNKKTHA